MKMTYPEKFKQIVSECTKHFETNAVQANLIGWGNPNAKILILGKEPAIDMETENGQLQYRTEIAQNKWDWYKNTEQGLDFNDVFNEYSKTKLYGNPLYPHCWQKFRIKKRKAVGGEGTAHTWYQYQKLINMIIGKTSTAEDYLDFHKYCFSSDLSEFPLLSSGSKCSPETLSSIENRLAFFKSDFFKSFPIVIAAIGNYAKYIDIIELMSKAEDPHEYKIESGNGVSFIESKQPTPDQEPRLIVVAYQLSARISDKYLQTIAGKVIDFSKNSNVSL